MMKNAVACLLNFQQYFCASSMQAFQLLTWHRSAWCLLFCWTVDCALSPSGTYQGCQGCCSGTFTSSGECSGGFSCPVADSCCYNYTVVSGGSGSGCQTYCDSGKYCCSWGASVVIYPGGGSTFVIRTQACQTRCNIPPPSSFQGSVSGGSNYWTGCGSSNSGTIAMSGAAVGELWDGVYSSVSTSKVQGATLLTVIGSATLSSLTMQSSEATATIQGTVTNIYTTTFSPSIVITGAQPVPSITSGAGTPTITGTGTVTTLSVSGGGGVDLRAPAIISTLTGAGAATIAGTVGLASISGATTVSNGGMIATLTQSGQGL